MNTTPTHQTDQLLQARMKEIMLEFFNFAFDHNGTDLVAPYLYGRTAQIWEEEKAAFTDASTLSCHKGCAHCCHLPIMCPPDLSFYIAKQLRNHYPEDKLKRLVSSLETATQEIEDTPEAERLLLRIRCPLLKDDNSCSIYEIRPFSCRAFTSSDDLLCAQLANTDDDRDITIDQDNFGFMLYQTATTVLVALSQRSNRSSEQVYFFPALLNALKDPMLEQSWHEGQILNELGLIKA